MRAHYGYKDGSGEYFIVVDTDKCDGCGRCVSACPCGVFEVGEDENDPFRETTVAKVSESHRKKIKYSCASCKPGSGKKSLPCLESCAPGAIGHSW
jgi:Fe-S-cluster-containing hydrogenase component 2